MNTQKNMQSQPNTNLRLEQAVIAGLLVSPEAIFDVADRLQPDMFSDNRTGFVYRAVLSLMASGTAVDMLTVENEMRRLDNGLYIQLNGLSFLSDMLLDVRSDAHIRIHADELVRCYTLYSQSSSPTAPSGSGCPSSDHRVISSVSVVVS